MQFDRLNIRPLQCLCTIRCFWWFRLVHIQTNHLVFLHGCMQHTNWSRGYHGFSKSNPHICNDWPCDLLQFIWISIYVIVAQSASKTFWHFQLSISLRVISSNGKTIWTRIYSHKFKSFASCNLFKFLSLNNISPIYSHNILNYHYPYVILAVFKFIKTPGYSI